MSAPPADVGPPAQYGGYVARGDEVRVFATVAYLSSTIEAVLLLVVAVGLTVLDQPEDAVLYWALAAFSLLAFAVSFAIGYTFCIRSCSSPAPTSVELWAFMAANVVSIVGHIVLVPGIFATISVGPYVRTPAYFVIVPLIQVAGVAVSVRRLLALRKAAKAADQPDSVAA